VVQAQKTWRKHNAAMILATQSIKELEESGMLAIVAESCPTRIFLANPQMNREIYREAFHLNHTETGPDRWPRSTGSDADSESPDLKESADERRFGRTGWQPTTPVTTLRNGTTSTALALQTAFAILRNTTHSGRARRPDQPPTKNHKGEAL